MSTGTGRGWRRRWSAARKLARAGGERIHRVATQVPERAWRAGRDLARKVISVQRAARLPEHLMQRSAWSVIERRGEARPADAAWRAGYRQAAEARVPGLALQVTGPEADREAGE